MNKEYLRCCICGKTLEEGTTVMPIYYEDGTLIGYSHPFCKFNLTQVPEDKIDGE